MIEHVLRINSQDYVVNPINHIDFTVNKYKVNEPYDYYSVNKPFQPIYNDKVLNSVEGLYRHFTAQVLDYKKNEHRYIVRNNNSYTKNEFKFDGSTNYGLTKKHIEHFDNTTNKWAVKIKDTFNSGDNDAYIYSTVHYIGVDLIGLGIIRLSTGNYRVIITNSSTDRVYVESQNSYFGENEIIVKYNGNKDATGITITINGANESFNVLANTLATTYLNSAKEFIIGGRYDDIDDMLPQYSSILQELQIWSSDVITDTPDLLDVKFDQYKTRKIIDKSKSENDVLIYGDVTEEQFIQTYIEDNEKKIIYDSTFSGLSVEVDLDTSTYKINTNITDVYTNFKTFQNIKYNIYDEIDGNKILSINAPTDFVGSEIAGNIKVFDILEMFVNKFTNNLYTLDSNLFENEVTNPVGSDSSYSALGLLYLTKASNLINATFHSSEDYIFDDNWSMSFSQLISDLYFLFNIMISFDEENFTVKIENAKTRLQTKEQNPNNTFVDYKYLNGLRDKNKYSFKEDDTPNSEVFSTVHESTEFDDDGFEYIVAPNNSNNTQEHKLIGYTDINGVLKNKDSYSRNLWFFTSLNSAKTALEIINSGSISTRIVETMTTLEEERDIEYFGSAANYFGFKSLGLEYDEDSDNSKIYMVLPVGELTIDDVIRFDLSYEIGCRANRLLSLYSFAKMRGIKLNDLKCNFENTPSSSNLLYTASLINIDSFSSSENASSYMISNFEDIHANSQDSEGYNLFYDSDGVAWYDPNNSYNHPYSTQTRDFRFFGRNTKPISLTTLNYASNAGILIVFPWYPVSSKHSFNIEFEYISDWWKNLIADIDLDEMEIAEILYNGTYEAVPRYQETIQQLHLSGIGKEQNLEFYNFNLKTSTIINNYHRYNRYQNSAKLISTGATVELSNRKRIRQCEPITPRLENYDTFDPINYIDTLLSASCEIVDYEYDPNTQNFKSLNYICDSDIRPYTGNSIITFSHETIYDVQILDIDEHTTTITASVYAGSDLSDILPYVVSSYGSTVFTRSGATINPQSFENEVTWSCISESGISRTITINLIVSAFNVSLYIGEIPIGETYQIIGMGSLTANSVIYTSQYSNPNIVYTSESSLRLALNEQDAGVYNFNVDINDVNQIVSFFFYFTCKALKGSVFDFRFLPNLQTLNIGVNDASVVDSTDGQELLLTTNNLRSLYADGYNLIYITWDKIKLGTVNYAQFDLQNNNMSSEMVEDCLREIWRIFDESSISNLSYIYIQGTNAAPVYEIYSCLLTSALTGWSIGDEVTFTDGSGSGFVAECYYVDGTTANPLFRITNRGSGYSTLPTTAFSSDSGLSATIAEVSTAFSKLQLVSATITVTI